MSVTVVHFFPSFLLCRLLNEGFILNSLVLDNNYHWKCLSYLNWKLSSNTFILILVFYVLNQKIILLQCNKISSNHISCLLNCCNYVQLIKWPNHNMLLVIQLLSSIINDNIAATSVKHLLIRFTFLVVVV